jgi:hypothetical protein
VNFLFGKKGSIMGLFGFFRKRNGQASDQPVQKRALSTREAEIICREFGQFLAEKLPLIKDAELLPYPKERIIEALNISIKRVQKQTDPDARLLLNALEVCRHGLSLFSEIDPQDREAVAYFNQFPNAKAVTEQRKRECLDLITKYMKRGMEIG